MRAAALLLPILLLLLVLAVVVIVAAVRPQPEPADRPGPRLSSVRSRTARWRWVGVALGIVLAVGAIQVGGELGRGPMLAAPLFALGVLAGVISEWRHRHARPDQRHSRYVASATTSLAAWPRLWSRP